MENPKIKIESDGHKIEFYANGEKVDDIKSLVFNYEAGYRPQCLYSVDVVALALGKSQNPFVRKRE